MPGPEGVWDSGRFEDVLGGEIVVTEVTGNSLVSNTSCMNVKAVSKMWVGLERFYPAMIGQFFYEWQRGVRQCERAGARDGTWHVCDTIVHDFVDHVSRVCMRRRMARLEATTLVDRDIDHYRATAHVFDVFCSHQLGCCSAGDKHGTNYEVGLDDAMIDGLLGGIDRRNATAEDIVDLPETRHRSIEDGYVSTQSNCHVGRIQPGNIR